MTLRESSEPTSGKATFAAQTLLPELEPRKQVVLDRLPEDPVTGIPRSARRHHGFLSLRTGDLLQVVACSTSNRAVPRRAVPCCLHRAGSFPRSAAPKGLLHGHETIPPTPWKSVSAPAGQTWSFAKAEPATPAPESAAPASAAATSFRWARGSKNINSPRASARYQHSNHNRRPDGIPPYRAGPFFRVRAGGRGRWRCSSRSDLAAPARSFADRMAAIGAPLSRISAFLGPRGRNPCRGRPRCSSVRPSGWLLPVAYARRPILQHVFDSTPARHASPVPPGAFLRAGSPVCSDRGPPCPHLRRHSASPRHPATRARRDPCGSSSGALCRPRAPKGPQAWGDTWRRDAPRARPVFGLKDDHELRVLLKRGSEEEGFPRHGQRSTAPEARSSAGGGGAGTRPRDRRRPSKKKKKKDRPPDGRRPSARRCGARQVSIPRSCSSRAPMAGRSSSRFRPRRATTLETKPRFLARGADPQLPARPPAERGRSGGW